MRIALIAHHVAPIRAPFIGGVESHTSTLAHWLAARGHDVTLFALPGSEVAGVRVEPLNVDLGSISEAARRDVSSMPPEFVAAHHAYLEVLLEIAGRKEFDAIHVNSLHYLPVAMAATLPARPLLTLHCPPTPWLESALRIAVRAGRLQLDVVAVSPALAEAWAHVLPGLDVIDNGIDVEAWDLGAGGVDCAWFGRIVPEKAPHLAIDAARASGRRIRLAGPIVDAAYYEAEIVPRLGPDVAYLGHLTHPELNRLLGGSAVAIQSPAWEEPFGLAAAEATACGTPVASLPRGGLGRVLGTDGGVVAQDCTVQALAAAIDEASGLDRGRVRAHAQTNLSIGRMAEQYEARYRRTARREQPADRRTFAGGRWPAQDLRRGAMRGATPGRLVPANEDLER